MKEQLTVATVIFNLVGNSVLLVQRDAEEEWPRTWACPGGKVAPNESLEQAAVREVKEETGIAVNTIALVDCFLAKPYYMYVYVAAISDKLTLSARKNASWISLTDINNLELAPNTQASCIRAKQKYHLYQQVISLDNLKHNINRAQKYLLDHLLEYDGICGWSHYLGQSKIGLIGTSVGILGLVYTNYRGTVLQKAADTLVQLQSANGGWSTKATSPHGAVGVTESTALAILALVEVLGSAHEAVQKGIRWLIEAQGKDGGWGSSHSLLSIRRVYPTSLALRAIVTAASSNTSVIDNAISWLKAAQNPDGGWGTYSYADKVNRTSSTASHAAHALVTLMKVGTPKQDVIIKRGMDFLLQSWDFKKDEGWESTSEIANLYELSNEVGRVEYKLFSAPWVVVALLRSDVSIVEPSILKTVNDLVYQQDPQGFWSHKFTPGERPIWATVDMLMLLHEIEQPQYRPIQNTVLTILYREAQLTLSNSVTDYWSSLHSSMNLRVDDKDSKPPKTRRRFLIAVSVIIVITLLLILELTISAVSRLLSLPLLQQTLIWIFTVVIVPALGVFLFEWLSNYLKSQAKSK